MGVGQWLLLQAWGWEGYHSLCERKGERALELNREGELCRVVYTALAQAPNFIELLQKVVWSVLGRVLVGAGTCRAFREREEAAGGSPGSASG